MATLSPGLSQLCSQRLVLQPPSVAINISPSTARGSFLSLNNRSRFKCSASGQTGFFTKLGRLIKEKAKSDVEKIFSGFTKTRDNLAVIDELLLYWNLSDTDRVLDELEEVALITEFYAFITELNTILSYFGDWLGFTFVWFRHCWFLILDQRLPLRLWRVWGMTYMEENSNQEVKLK